MRKLQRGIKLTGQCLVRAVRDGAGRPCKRTCCGRSNAGREPIIADAAGSMSDRSDTICNSEPKQSEMFYDFSLGSICSVPCEFRTLFNYF